MHGLTTRRPGRRTTAAFVLALVMLTASSAVASGFFLPMRGVRPMGRAGAVAASGAGPHALWYNPAALTHLEGTHLLIDGALVTLSSSFQRTPRLAPNGDLISYAEVTNEKAPDVIPSLVFASDFGLERFVFSAGVEAPYGGRYIYPEDGPQRYATIRNDEAANAVISIGAAVEITEWLSFGASFQNIFFDTKLVFVGSAYQGLFGQPEDSDLDILMSIHSVDPFTPSGNIGLWAKPLEELELALSFQLPSRIEDTDAKVEVRLPTNALFDNAELEGDRISGGFDLPGVLRAAVRYVQPRWDLEFNFVWEGWSVHDAIETTPREVALVGVFHIDRFVLGPLDLQQDYQNTIGVALGSDYEVIPDRLVVRAGLSFEQGAIPDERLSSFQPDGDKITPTIGLTWMIPSIGLQIDAGYAHFFFLDREINNSQVEQINPTFEDGTIVVGNGFYKASVDAFGLGVEVEF